MERLNKHVDNWAGIEDGSKAVTPFNIARAFSETKPMRAPGASNEQMLLAMDIPGQLVSAIKKGLGVIGPRCLKGNAEILIGMYENMCLEHACAQAASEGQNIFQVVAQRPNL